MAEQGRRAARQGERPGHLVEAQQLLGLPLEDPALRLVLQDLAYPEGQLEVVIRLAQHLVRLRRAIARVVAEEDQHRRVLSQGLPDAPGHGCQRGIHQGERADEEVRRAVDDALDDPLPGARGHHRHPMSRAAEEARQDFGPLAVLVDESDVPERHPGSRQHG